MRIDDLNPHFWRTHDGGKTWTEIDNGIAPGAPANSIREDPRVKGLLYAATETQVWVSFDDGDHWESLRLDMPAISVRDLQVKDDSTCHCSDLVAATHGRGYWILDDVTPLRQARRRACGDHGVSVQAGAGATRSLRHQRPDALAARAPGRRESTHGRDHRLLPPGRGAGRRHARHRRCIRRGHPLLFQRRPGSSPRSRARLGRVQPPVPAHAGRAGLRAAALLAGAPECDLDGRGYAPRQLGSPLRADRDQWRAASWRRSQCGSGSPPDCSGARRALGAAGRLHRSSHGRRQDIFAATDPSARPSGEDIGSRTRTVGGPHPPDVRRRRQSRPGVRDRARARGAAGQPARQRRRCLQGAGRITGARAGARCASRTARPRGTGRATDARERERGPCWPRQWQCRERMSRRRRERWRRAIVRRRSRGKCSVAGPH